MLRKNAIASGKSTRAGKSNAKDGVLKKWKTWQLVVGLVVVVAGSVLFAVGVAGWFGGGKVALDAEYYCTRCEGEDCANECLEFANIDDAQYAELAEAEKSFVVFIDQDGCTTADKLRGYVQAYAAEYGVKFYRMMFDDAKYTSLHKSVKYYPSVAIVSRGQAVKWLRADSDEDADAYNDYDAFVQWMNSGV